MFLIKILMVNFLTVVGTGYWRTTIPIIEEECAEFASGYVNRFYNKYHSLTAPYNSQSPGQIIYRKEILKFHLIISLKRSYKWKEISTIFTIPLFREK